LFFEALDLFNYCFIMRIEHCKWLKVVFGVGEKD